MYNHVGQMRTVKALKTILRVDFIRNQQFFMEDLG